MGKWIEIEIADVDITKHFKQVEDEFEWYVDGEKVVLCIYKKTKKWMKRVLKFLIKNKIPFVFAPCNHERYWADFVYKENIDSFDYRTYLNINNLIDKQFEVEISQEVDATNHWEKLFSYPYSKLSDKIKSHIIYAKPHCKYKNALKLEKWQNGNPFDFNPWDIDVQDELEVDIKIDDCLYQLNTKHPDYKIAQSLMNVLEENNFVYNLSYQTFKKYDTKNKQDNRIMCFMVDILSNQIDSADYYLRDNIQKNLYKALKTIKKIETSGHPNRIINLVALIRDIIQRPDWEKMTSGLENIFSNDQEIQNKAVQKLGTLHSGSYNREYIPPEILKVYTDFYAKTLLYLNKIGLFPRGMRNLGLLEGEIETPDDLLLEDEEINSMFYNEDNSNY